MNQPRRRSLCENLFLGKQMTGGNRLQHAGPIVKQDLLDCNGGKRFKEQQSGGRRMTLTGSRQLAVL